MELSAKNKTDLIRTFVCASLVAGCFIFMKMAILLKDAIQEQLSGPPPTIKELIEEQKNMPYDIGLFPTVRDVTWMEETQSWCTHRHSIDLFTCTPEYLLPPESVQKWRAAIGLDPMAPRLNPMTGQWENMPEALPIPK